MIRYLAQVPRTPLQPCDLRTEHIDAYRRHRESTIGADAAGLELRTVAMTFETKPFSDLVPAEVRDRMRPRLRVRPRPRSGYSDAELARIVSAARSDVAALRQRLGGHGLGEDAAESRLLAETRKSGRVIRPGTGAPGLAVARRQVAEKIFVTRQDLIPMLVLLVATTGWNIEVAKELPSEHRVIEGLAVELELTKRRRGAGGWHRTVTWEIGPPGRELFTPGGVYLLLHQLMAPARELLQEPSFWAVWHNRGGREDGCRNPFGPALDASLKPQKWVRSHDLRADEPTRGPEEDHDPEHRAEAPPLRLDFNRLKTSIDVRRTHQMGGHLPSAARTNTAPVLFRNYLSGDRTTIEWAQELVADTLVEVEQAAWAAHRRALAGTGRTALRVVPASVRVTSSTPASGLEAESAERVAVGGLDTAWAACEDHEHHPLTGRRCAASFLDCFHCGNCVVTDAHLPRLLSLLDALETRRRHMADDAWWGRYGPTWAAIRYEVLPRFSEAEVDQAQTDKPSDSMLDLVEPAWERP
ncbi:hypothetical protein [Arthrobacter sp. U41]|uniref:hypothetical protein n=1 Tax=Arthrobacter sp. U41 TaxID=1849032 RepID=UPI0012F8F276|nr:hypothetical protein [Arthrobacter sp. U41]